MHKLYLEFNNVKLTIADSLLQIIIIFKSMIPKESFEGITIVNLKRKASAELTDAITFTKI